MTLDKLLQDGRIQPDGIDLTYLNMPVEETFFRMLRHREFDVAEMSLSWYMMARCRNEPVIALPIFPLLYLGALAAPFWPKKS